MDRCTHDRRILNYLPASIGPYTLVSHHSDSNDFAENKARAAELLQTYRDRAKLVITTKPCCVLSAIAMAIPVIVFSPPDDEPQPDLERVSSLSEIVRVFRPEEATLVNWGGYTLDVSDLKLRLLDSFLAMAAQCGAVVPQRLGPIAPSACPDVHYFYQYLALPQRLARLACAKAPDRQKWGTPASYKPDWIERAKMAARFIRDGSRVLEIGTGSGTLRTLIAGRCRYTGADLDPLDPKTLVLDLDSDELPCGPWDTIVLLEVLEHIYHIPQALRKIASATSHVVFSYCCRIDEQSNRIDVRPEFGWANSMSEQDVRDELAAIGFRVSGREPFNSTPEFEQIIFEFTK